MGKEPVEKRDNCYLSALSVADVIPTSDNPRVISEKDPAFLELVESVKAAGVLVPVHVRAHPKQAEKWDLRAGERRVRAAALAGLDTIPAIVHRAMTDVEAFELTFTENFVREDLTPIEQSNAVKVLMEKHDGDRNAVAAHLGKSRQWVALRVNLTKLSLEWLQAASDPDTTVFTYSIAHLELIARHDVKMQKEMLMDLRRSSHRTLKELKKYIDRRYLHGLDGAPRSMKEAKPSCITCRKRSSCQGQLFVIEGRKRQPDRCLDPHCWQKKFLAHLVERAGEIKAEHPDLAIISEGSIDRHDDREQYQDAFGSVPLNDWNYTIAKKGDKNIQAALVVHGKGMGELRWIKKLTADGGTGRVKGQVKPLKERRAALQKRREVRALADFRKLAEKATIKYEDYSITLITLAAGFGVKHNYSDPQGWSCFDGLKKKIARETKVINSPAQQKIVADELWRRVLPNLLSPLNPSYTTTSAIKHAERLAQLLSLDFDTCLKAAVEEIKEPKVWATLKADGSPKAKARRESKAAKREKNSSKRNKKGRKVNAKAAKVKDLPAGKHGSAGGPPAKKRGRPRKGVCRVCGCTETSPCPGGCAWTDRTETLCTACEDPNNLGQPRKMKKTRKSKGKKKT